LRRPVAREGDVGAALAIAAALALSVSMCALGAIVLVAGPGQSTEWAVYLVAFAVVAPLAALAGPLVLDSRGAAGAPLSLAAAAVGPLLAKLLADTAGVRPAAATLIAGALSLVAVAAALAGGPRIGGRRMAGAAWGIAGVALAAAPLVCLPDGSVDPLPLVVLLAAAVAAGLVASHLRLPNASGRVGALVDIVVVLMVLLVVPDLLVYSSGTGGTPGTEAFGAAVHMDFLLGPANDVLAGRPVLVETSSQYGVAPIYVLAGLFELIPIGYGTLGLLNGLAIALSILAVYAILRAAEIGRVVAVATVVVTAAAAVVNVELPLSGYPQLGPLRFGLPLLVVLFATLAARLPDRARPLRLAVLATVGVASVWSVETFVYTAATAGALILLEAARADDLRRAGRVVLVETGLALAACVVAHVAVAGATLVASGELPDWGTYLAYFETYATGGLSDIAGFDFLPFSLGLAVAAAILLSTVAAIALVLLRPPIVAARPAALTAIVAATGMAVAEFTYFVGRSIESGLPVVAVPPILLGGLWAGLALGPGTEPATRRLAAGLAVWAAALLLAGASGRLDYLERTPAGYVARGESPIIALERLWEGPPLDARAAAGETLLSEEMPGDGGALVITESDLGTEILVRAERPNLLRFGHPRQDDLIRDELVPVLEEQIDSLPDGTRMLTQRSVLDAPRSPDPLAEPVPLFDLAPPVPLQRWALAEIEERYRLEPVRSEGDLEVVELRRRAQPSE
jgi:hypothetical protein